MVSSQDHRVCSACSFENVPGAAQCAQCGVSLRSVTTLASPAMTSLETLQPLAQPANLSANEVMFLIAGQSDSITVSMAAGTHQLLIGRGIGSEDRPDLDLTAYSSAAESVSRSHALLDFSEERATITDLGSTNGSWLNENRLTPHDPRVLHNGDLLRVGQQFMFVYFAARLDATEIVALIDRHGRVSQLTADTWVRIGAFFETLGAIQDICNAARGKPQKQIAIRELKANQVRELVKVRVADASDALHLVTRVVTPWCRQHLPGADQTTYADQDWQELEHLILTTLEQLMPEISQTERAVVVQQLSAPLRSIAVHTFELSAAERWD